MSYALSSFSQTTTVIYYKLWQRPLLAWTSWCIPTTIGLLSQGQRTCIYMSKRLGSPAAVKHIIKVVSYQISSWVYCHDRDCDIFESCHLKIELFPYDEEMLVLKVTSF